MATRPSGRTNTASVKRKSHPTFAEKTEKNNRSAAKDKALHQAPGGPPQFPCSFSLNNLIRLDWSHRREFFPHGPGPTRYDQFGFNGRTYTVESLNPETAGSAFVILEPEARYYTVPVYEEGQATNAPARILLIQYQRLFGEPRPHLAVVEPLELTAPNEPFAHLHIIGGDDGVNAEPALTSAGMVEAVLTVIEATPVRSVSDAPSSPPLLSPPQISFTSDDRARLHQILAQQFSLDELRNLAFDLGVGYDRLPYDATEQFSLELVRHLEAQEELSCLVSEASKYCNNGFLKQLTAKLPPCTPRTKVQIVMELGAAYDMAAILNDIAALIGIKPDDIELLGTATGSLRILISLAQTAVNSLMKIQIENQVLGGSQIISIMIFTSLDGASQAAWRVVSRRPNRPPTSWNSVLAMFSGDPDPDLLACIDYFHEIKATYVRCAPALSKVQGKFYDYLKRKYGLDVLPIDVGATPYSQWLGHVRNDSTVLRLAGVSDGIIVRVNQDGFRRGTTIKRPAEVVVNQPPITTIRRVKQVRLDRFYVEIDAPKTLTIENLLEEAGSHFKLIDAIYSIFSLTLSPLADLRRLATELQSYSRSSSQLSQLANALALKLQATHLAPLRLRYGSRNARRDAPQELPFSFVVIGDAVPLDATREIILKQAADQGTNKYFVPPDVEWLMTRVRRLRRLDDQTCEALARGIAWLLSQFALAVGLRMEYVVSTIEFERNGTARGEDLTLDFMTTTVRPYLGALENLQRAVDRIRGQAPHTVTILSLETNPINISFRGGFDAVPIARDTITPWRRAHLKDLQRVANKPAKIELLEKGARTILRQARIKAMRVGLEIRREKLEIEKTNLAREILKDMGLNLRRMTDTQVEPQVKEILPAITTIVNSGLTLTAA